MCLTVIVLHPEDCREHKSRKLCRCFQHIVLSLSTRCPASTQTRLDCVLMLISHSVSGGSIFANNFLTGAPSAACCLSVCLTLPVLFRCECQNNQIGEHWHEHSEVEFVSQISPFATLHPGKQILKMSLLSGVVFAMQGYSLTGKINWYRSEDDNKAILRWSFRSFSNGFIFFF